MQVGNIVQEKITSIGKKRKNPDLEFIAEEHEGLSSQEISSSKVNISSLWTLQIDNYAQDVENLNQVGKALIDQLNNIRMGLISSQLSEEDMMSLSKTLDNAKFESQFPDLEELVNEIRLRAEVELAKLEYVTKIRNS